MDLHLAGQRAIVTGASRGIGLACVRGLAAEGVHVTMVARDPDALAAAAATVPGPGTVRTAVADTTDDAAVRAMVAGHVGALGGVDILVNAAARPGRGAHRSRRSTSSPTTPSSTSSTPS